MNSDSIILDIEIDEKTVAMTITDFGHAFEPSEATQPDIKAALEERQMGGFGLFFIYQCMNEVSHINHGDISMFATLFYGVIDTPSGALRYINAGYEPPGRGW